LDREIIEIIMFVVAIVSAVSLLAIALELGKIAKELKRRNDWEV
jgi:energy-converting hydrogenase Eha subunit A